MPATVVRDRTRPVFPVLVTYGETMDLIEVEQERTLRREEAAAWLRLPADSLSRHNEVEFDREGLKYRHDVADEVTMSVEIEVGDDGNEIEIEINW